MTMKYARQVREKVNVEIYFIDSSANYMVRLSSTPMNLNRIRLMVVMSTTNAEQFQQRNKKWIYTHRYIHTHTHDYYLIFGIFEL